MQRVSRACLVELVWRARHHSSERLVGYRRCRSPEGVTGALLRVYEECIILEIRQGLSATVHAQLSDVQNEMNGLLTEDREVVMVHGDTVRAVPLPASVRDRGA
ncbi:hypothetical protein [Streptomyces sp. NBC_01285]|uniref:hypothetical protein n=1 Tax=Streptomyces sp. NBC_01285 TaxID=2903813 RepID=UPI0022563AF2|nr:hypothetical protein [Streptomyces sp. NBC_01285]MCX4769807.1 hypothetical protein [Streptomyces sp. NBC_01285]